MYDIERCELVAGKLSRIRCDESVNLTDLDCQKVLKVIRSLKVTVDDFTFLDEKPGWIGYKIKGREWHWKLRQTRNRLTKGLFDILRSNEADLLNVPSIGERGMYVVVEDVSHSACWIESKQRYQLLSHQIGKDGYLILPAAEWHDYPNLNDLLNAMCCRAPLDRWKAIE